MMAWCKIRSKLFRVGAKSVILVRGTPEGLC
jgi:hypothetical protein